MVRLPKFNAARMWLTSADGAHVFSYHRSGLEARIGDCDFAHLPGTVSNTKVRQDFEEYGISTQRDDSYDAHLFFNSLYRYALIGNLDWPLLPELWQFLLSVLPSRNRPGAGSTTNGVLFGGRLRSGAPRRQESLQPSRVVPADDMNATAGVELPAGDAGAISAVSAPFLRLMRRLRLLQRRQQCRACPRRDLQPRWSWSQTQRHAMVLVAAKRAPRMNSWRRWLGLTQAAQCPMFGRGLTF